MLGCRAGILPGWGLARRPRWLCGRRTSGEPTPAATDAGETLGVPTDSSVLAEAMAELESYFTPPEKFQDVSRGNPLPHLCLRKKSAKSG